MKWCLFFLAIAILGSATSSSSPAKDIFGGIFRQPPPPPVSEEGTNRRLVFEEWITQPLDHFDQANSETWQMRYFSNNEHYVPGGPLFIYVGGEWEITYGWVTGGHMYDMAKEMNGYIFYTEHRYYGQSLPTSDASTENLKYLDVNQALADLAVFIDYQRATLPGASNSGVILVGASYSATMVTWFKQAYPDMVNGVWASSAPLFAKAAFVEYKEVVSSTIKQVGPEGCADRIERAIAELEASVDAGDTTRASTAFNTCDTLNSDLDISTFFSAISNRFAGLVQYHDEGDIDAMCAIIMDESITDDVEALVSYIRGSSTDCYDVGYQAFVDYYTDIAWGSDSTDAYRQWFYQTCNEYGWYQTSESDEHIFGNKFTVELYAQMCADVYDQTFDLEIINANTLATNNRHNGFFPVVNNVFFTHGEFDPWRPMGVTEPINESTPTVILLGYAHCADLYSHRDSDSAQMTATKVAVTASVRMWLGMD